MSERHPKLLLQDILDSAGKIIDYTNNLSYEDFTQDSKTVDAVMRNFEIIGEAANRLPQNFKENASSVDWFRIRGFRNRVAHHYFGIDYEIVWELKNKQLPNLIKEITTLLQDNY